ncbi:MAG: hypothetical protein JWO31_1838, partial [Phycisphaerales bacterium]|nr:hypothetical protein [Phycisphaerales bacterium]
LTTLVLGPWGMISLIVSPFFLLNNVFRYATALPMPAVPPGARVPQLDPTTYHRLLPHADTLFTRLNGGEELTSVVTGVASSVGGVTPGQVLLFVSHLARQSQPQPAQPFTGGFPVLPAASAGPPPLPVQAV